MSRKAILTRICDDGKQTLGVITLFVDDDIVAQYKTLELSWKDNKTSISCIPKGWYNCIPYKSPSKGDVYLLEHVYGRGFIEIHSGNFYTDIQGCILVGDDYKRINSDKHYDVVNSRDTLNRIKEYFNYKEFLLIIK